MELKHKIGDQAWKVDFKNKSKRITCEDCQGKKYLTVIMGDGSQVTIECCGCREGYEPAKGYNLIWENEVAIIPSTITSIEIKSGEIHYRQTIGYTTGEVYATKENAMAKGEEIRIEYIKSQEDKLKRKYKNHKTWAWNATYHKSQIKRAEQDLLYHTKSLDYANLKKREKHNENV